MRGLRLLCSAIAGLLLAAGVAPLLAEPAAPSSQPASTSRTLATPHYDIVTDGPDPAPVGRLLEAFHIYASDFFGRAPSVRLKVQVYGTFEAYQAAVDQYSGVANIHHLRDSLGMFTWDTGIAHVAMISPIDGQGGDTLLHEAAHQFHLLRHPYPIFPRSAFYKEGIAHLLDDLEWDGNALRLPGPSQIPSFETLGAFDAWASGTRTSVKSLATDESLPHREGASEARAFVAFLRQTDIDRYAKWADLIEKLHPLDEAFDQTFGTIENLDEQYGAWLREQVAAAPWWSADNGWHRQGNIITAEAADEADASTAFLRRIDRPMTIRCEGVQANLAQAIFFDYDPTDSTAASIWISVLPGFAWISRTSTAGSEHEPYRPVPGASPADFTVRLVPEEAGVTVFVDGTDVGTFERRPGSFVGLRGDSVPLRFTVTIDDVQP